MGLATRQTHLGPSSKKDLAIVDLHIIPKLSDLPDLLPIRLPPSSSPVTIPTFMFKLPQELLVPIIELAIFEPNDSFGCSDCSFTPNARRARLLSLVCWRISHIAQPMLFHTISFTDTQCTYEVPAMKSIIQLHHALGQNPSLRQHCRRFTLDLSDIGGSVHLNAQGWRIAKDFARWLTRVRCFRCYGYGGGKGMRDSWGLTKSWIQKLGDFRHWELHSGVCKLYLHNIADVQTPKLEHLGLHGIYHHQWQDHSLLLDPKLLGTASFTSLAISDYEKTPQSIAQLIQWPARLERFKFGSYYINPWMTNYPMFQLWLSIHSESLKTIEIGYLSHLGGENKHVFDATLFPNLESLTISRWQMGGYRNLLPFTAESAKLLGPKMTLFGWDFGINDQHSESWKEFGENEEAWIQELGKHAIAHKAALKTVKVKFRPDNWYDTVQSDGYPWNRMDNIRDKFLRPNGIDLVYSRPPVSKEQWLEEIEKRQTPDALAGTVHGDDSESDIGSRVEMQDEEEEEDSDIELRVYTPLGFHGRDIRDYFSSSKDTSS